MGRLTLYGSISFNFLDNFLTSPNAATIKASVAASNLGSPLPGTVLQVGQILRWVLR